MGPSLSSPSAPANEPKPKKKTKAYLPARIPADQLETYGYKQISPTRAKHRRYPSYRNFCFLCQEWTKRGDGRVCDRHAF
jgi:hypothetical protein